MTQNKSSEGVKTPQWGRGVDDVLVDGDNADEHLHHNYNSHKFVIVQSKEDQKPKLLNKSLTLKI